MKERESGYLRVRWMHWSMGRRFRRRGWKNWRIRGRREGGLEEEWGSGKGEREEGGGEGCRLIGMQG